MSRLNGLPRSHPPRPIIRETWHRPTDRSTTLMEFVFPDGKIGNLTFVAHPDGSNEVILDRLDSGIKVTVARRSDVLTSDVHTFTT